MKKLFLLLFLLANIAAKTQSEYKHRYIGLGCKIGVFQASELNMNMPVNRVYFNVDPIKYARVDFQWGMSNNTSEQTVSIWPIGTQTFKLKDKNSIWMVGAFGQYWFDDLLLYAGIRFGTMNYSDQSLNYDSFTGLYSTVINKGKITLMSPTLGGEFRFGNRFSVGAETSFTKMKDTYQPIGSTNGIETISSLIETSAYFRFYPF
jgi:hypothetical protein